MADLILAPLSEAQRALVLAAEALGATAPARARELAELPRLAARDLDDLVDRGLVREAAEGRFYVYRPRRASVPGSPLSATPAGPARWSRERVLKVLVFWLLFILIPVVFVWLTSSG
jgi:hypothetical protein